MLEAYCGCIFRSPSSIPPEKPCPAAEKLLHELQGGGFWQAERYMKHMKLAWNTLKEVTSG